MTSGNTNSSATQAVLAVMQWRSDASHQIFGDDGLYLFVLWRLFWASSLEPLSSGLSPVRPELRAKLFGGSSIKVRLVKVQGVHRALTRVGSQSR